MIRDLGVQLYSLRNEAKEDFAGVLRFVAETGYKAVEPAGFWNYTPREFKKVCDDLGLRIASSHSPWARKVEDVPAIVDTLGELGLRQAVCGFNPDDFKDLDAIKRSADLVNAMQEAFDRQGVTLFQHNHSFEFERLDGELKYTVYARLCPKVKFQIDAFWSSNFGANDPAEMIRLFAPRMVSLHLKDGSFEHDPDNFKMVNGYLDRKLELRPLGTGEMNIPAILAATPESIDTIIVELDSCIIDMREALRQSYRYMTENGLGAGTR